MSDIVVSMLPVGQGAMNLIEVYDDKDKLANLTLIDCGSVESRESVCYESMHYVRESMAARLANGKIMFDNVIITHLDTDHWNLLRELFSDKFIIKKEKGFGEIDILFGESDDYTETYESDAGASSANEFVYAAYYKKYEGSTYKKVVYDRLTRNKHYTVTYFDEQVNKELEISLYENDYLDISYVDCKDNSTYWIKANVEIDDKIYIEKSGEEEESSLEGYNLYDWNSIKRVYDILIHKLIDKIPKMILTILDDIPTLLNIIYDNTHSGTMIDRKYITNFYLGGITEQWKRLCENAYNELQFAKAISDNFVPNINDKINIELDVNWNLRIIARYKMKCIPHVHNNRKSTAVKKNAASAVSILYAADDSNIFKVFFPGDATVHTFYGIYLENDYAIIQNAVWTAPHHGSYVTMQGRMDDGSIIFPIFLDHFEPAEIIISAGYANGYKLPNRTFIRMTGEYFKKNNRKKEEHFIFYNTNKEQNKTWKYCLANVPIYTLLSEDDKCLDMSRICYTRRTYEYIKGDKSYDVDVEKMANIPNHLYEYLPIYAVYIKEENDILPGQPRPPLEYTVPVPNRIPSRNMLFHRT